MTQIDMQARCKIHQAEKKSKNESKYADDSVMPHNNEMNIGW